MEVKSPYHQNICEASFLLTKIGDLQPRITIDQVICLQYAIWARDLNFGQTFFIYIHTGESVHLRRASLLQNGILIVSKLYGFYTHKVSHI